MYGVNWGLDIDTGQTVLPDESTLTIGKVRSTDPHAILNAMLVPESKNIILRLDSLLGLNLFGNFRCAVATAMGKISYLAVKGPVNLLAEFKPLTSQRAIIARHDHDMGFFSICRRIMQSPAVVAASWYKSLFPRFSSSWRLTEAPHLIIRVQ